MSPSRRIRLQGRDHLKARNTYTLKTEGSRRRVHVFVLQLRQAGEKEDRHLALQNDSLQA